MTVESDKTGQHLRDHVLQMGVEERMRAIQALSGNYLNDSRGTLSSLLLASLGGKTDTSVAVDDNGASDDSAINATASQSTAALAMVFVGEVADSMQQCANDAVYAKPEASSAS